MKLLEGLIVSKQLVAKGSEVKYRDDLNCISGLKKGDNLQQCRN